MQRINLIATIFTRCGASCDECSEGNLEIIVPMKSNKDLFFSGVIDTRCSLLDITYDLEDIFDVDFCIEEYGKRIYQEHIRVFSPTSLGDVKHEAKLSAERSMELMYQDFYLFAQRIEQSMTNLCSLLKFNDLD